MNFFWDIDGTLLTTSGVGLGPLMRAISKYFPNSRNLTRQECSGKTDFEIVRTLVGEENWQQQSLVELIIKEYNLGLSLALDKNPALGLGGVEECLLYLKSQEKATSYIVSGNNQYGAELKLRSSKLDHFFPAINRFTSSYNSFNRVLILNKAIKSTSNTPSLVIGDSPNDILAARKHSLKVLAVATGLHDSKELSLFEPDFLAPALSVSILHETIDMLN